MPPSFSSDFCRCVLTLISACRFLSLGVYRFLSLGVYYWNSGNDRSYPVSI